MSVSCKLVVGFEVRDSDLFLRTWSKDLTCKHSQVDPEAKFCSTCGIKCKFEVLVKPTPILLEIAKVYIAPRYDSFDASEVDWENEVNETLEEGEGPLHNVARVQGGRDTGITMVIGEQLNYIHEADTASVSVVDAERLEGAIYDLKAVRDSLKFPKNREVRLFMSLYYS